MEAGRAFTRALELKKAENVVFGLSCTAALISEKPKKGNHRAHIAIWVIYLPGKLKYEVSDWSKDLEYHFREANKN